MKDNKNMMWKLFCKAGKIGYYSLYKNLSDNKENNNCNDD